MLLKTSGNDIQTCTWLEAMIPNVIHGWACAVALEVTSNVVQYPKRRFPMLSLQEQSPNVVQHPKSKALMLFSSLRADAQ